MNNFSFAFNKYSLAVFLAWSGVLRPLSKTWAFESTNEGITIYSPFHKTLPRSNAFVNWISIRFYETGCMFHFLRGSMLRVGQLLNQQMKACVVYKGYIFFGLKWGGG